MDQCTLCTWINPYSFQREYSTFFTYATSRSNNEYAGCFSKRTGAITVGIDIGRQFMEFDCPHIKWQAGQWYHICNTWFGSTGHIRLYVNGKRCFNNSNDISILSPGDQIQSSGVFVMGQDQDDLDSKYDAEQAFHGDMVDLNLWNEVLTEEQINEIGNCSKRKEGNIIAGLKTPTLGLNVYISETELCT